MLSARATFMSEYLRVRALYKSPISKRLIFYARDTAYTEKNMKKAFESIGIHPLDLARC